MHISKFQVLNYKSFYRSREVELKPGFNVIVGKNNSGKTALIEVLKGEFNSNPHKSLKSVPAKGTQLKQSSKLKVQLSFDPGEVFDIASYLGDTNYIVPKRSKSIPGHENISYLNDEISKGVIVNTEIHNGTENKINIKTEDGGGKMKVRYNNDTNNFEPGLRGGNSTSLSKTLYQHFENKIFYFSAQRLNISRCRFGKQVELDPSARNLPEVLNVMQSVYHRYKRFNGYVRRVLPQIEWVSVTPIDDSHVEIKVWNVPPETDRDDLAVPLSESGTGVSQVLSMLYVVLTSDTPRTIIIDEPQSFLHPGAIRKLLGVMKEHPEHQYIISTHSPAVISACDPDTLTLVRLEGAESKLYPLDIGEARDLRMSLAEVGARLSDVFGADDILWVEGRTEESCFPAIYEGVSEKSLLGTEILGVRHTGDFESNQAEDIFAVYEKLSQGRGLLPPAVGFFFDREDRSERELRDLKRRGDGAIRFTSRRMYENYLLYAPAIAAVLSALDREGPEYTDDQIETWISENASKFSNGDGYGTGEWLKTVHGADLLKRLFEDLSNARVAYDKVRHGTALTRWLIENASHELQDIADEIANAIERGREQLSSDTDFTV